MGLKDKKKTKKNKELAQRDLEPVQKDWEGKIALIQCAKAMGIQKFVLFSIHNCDKHPEVPLMEIKYCTEKFLKDSGINHVIIRACGFMQGIIVQYAVPILEEKSVWGTDAPTRIAYMDTQVISEVLSSDTVFSVPMNETYSLLGVDAKDIVTLEKYLQDYFTNILKKLKDLKAQSKQSDIYF